MELTINTLYELRQLISAEDETIRKCALRVIKAGTRECLAANTEIHGVLLGACREPDYQRDVRADLGITN